MRVCPQCAWENPDLAAFCTNCGTALERVSSPGQKGPWRFRAPQGSDGLGTDLELGASPGSETLNTDMEVPKTAALEANDGDDIAGSGGALVTHAENQSLPEELVTAAESKETITLGIGEGHQVATAIDMPKIDIQMTARDALTNVLPTESELPELSGRSIHGARTLVELTAPDVKALSQLESDANENDESSQATPRDTVVLSSRPVALDEAEGAASGGPTIRPDLTNATVNESEALGTASAANGEALHSGEAERVGAGDPRSRLRSVLSRVMSPAQGALETEASQKADADSDEKNAANPILLDTQGHNEPSQTLGHEMAVAADMESIDFAVESLDGEDSLSELSHALIRNTASRNASVNSDLMGEILTTRDLQPIDTHSPEGLAAAVAALNQTGSRGTALLSPPSGRMGQEATEVRYVLRMMGEETENARVISLTDAPMTIGRVEGDVRLAEDDYLSPTHLRLTQQSSGVLIEDLGSLNGVWIRLRSGVRIGAGDEVLIGEQRFLIAPYDSNDGGVHAADGTRRLGTQLGDAHIKLVRISASGGACGEWPVPQRGLRIGRVFGELVFNADRLMSGTHALFVHGEEGMECHDLGSTNGSWLRLREQAILTYGDSLLIGRTVWRLGRPAL